MLPKCCGYELQKGDDVEGSELGAWGFAVEKEVEEFEADRMTLIVQSIAQ